MGHRFRFGDIVYSHNIDFRLVLGTPNEIPAYSTESINSNFNRHNVSSNNSLGKIQSIANVGKLQ